MIAIPDGTLIAQRYQVVRTIGGGGMGRVYEACDTSLGSTVALKQLILSTPLAQQAFAREASILAPLNHPMLPNVSHYFVDTQWGHFLVMRYIPGDDLAQMLIRQQQPFPLYDVLKWADQLLDVLEYLHQQQIIHRDIKPANLKLTSKGTIMLLDFGIAKQNTGGHTIIGTPGFAPPEQMQGRGTDARSDMYALAATMYCLLTNQAPADSLTRVVARSQKQRDPLAPLHTVNPHVPRAVSDVVMQGLALDAHKRPASAAVFRQQLHQATRTTVPTSKFTRGCLPLWVLSVMVLTLLLGLTLGLAFWLDSRDSPTPTVIAEATNTPAAQSSHTAATPTPDPAPSTGAMTVATEPPTATATVLAPTDRAPSLVTQTPQPRPAWLPEMLPVPAGPFLMGSWGNDPIANDNEIPQHPLELPPYSIGRTEVTNAQFRPFVEGDGYTNPAYWTAAGWQWRISTEVNRPWY
ncbi:MAG: protein kinase, partial [Chloroflexaceae bacterium]|nr:protein kinase [Chloroflexaceae bacterium]